MENWSLAARLLLAEMDRRKAQQASEQPQNGSEKFNAGRVCGIDRKSNNRFFQMPESAGPRTNADSISGGVTMPRDGNARWVVRIVVCASRRAWDGASMSSVGTVPPARPAANDDWHHASSGTRAP